MIPKKIHYCWFGRNPQPALAKKCIASWKKYCPDYEIIEWNEDNFDVNSNQYTREAYAAKKWAFVTDYVRLFVLNQYGGIYMDTDVEVRKPLDCFLENQAFSGFETPQLVPTGIMAAESRHPFIQKLLSYYDNHPFIVDGEIDTTTNVIIITNTFLECGLKQNNSLQTIEGFTLYPSDYFCPKDYLTGIIRETKNTYTIHHFNGSWKSDGEIKWLENRRVFFTFLDKSRLFNMLYGGKNQEQRQIIMNKLWHMREGVKSAIMRVAAKSIGRKN